VWIASTLGFFSIVADQKDDAYVHVRARQRRHLEQLVEHLARQTTLRLERHLLATPERDYPWRLVLPRRYLSTLLHCLAETVDYPNFKAAVKRIDPAAAAAYARVWAVLRTSIDEREAPLPFRSALLGTIADEEEGDRG
jgi:hypothetical protein